MEKRYVIPIMLGAGILMAAISTSLLPLQQQLAYGTVPALKKPANPAGAPPANTTGTLTANTTAGPLPTPPANPAGAPPASPLPAKPAG
jgi:hypothetical protein